MEIPMFGGGGPLEASAISSSRMKTITSSGTTHTKGSYTDLITATSYEAVGFWLTINTGNEFSAAWFVDIAVEISATTTIILPDFFFSNIREVNTNGISTYIPLNVPRGAKLKARCSCLAASKTIDLGVMIVPPNQWMPTGFTTAKTYGATVGSSTGVDVDPGGTANTKGSYAQITSSVTFPIRAITVCAATSLDASSGNGNFSYDLAIGAASSEVVIVPDFFNVRDDTTKDISHVLCQGPIPISIASGERIAMRGQSSITNVSHRMKDFVVIGYS